MQPIIMRAHPLARIAAIEPSAQVNILAKLAPMLYRQVRQALTRINAVGSQCPARARRNALAATVAMPIIGSIGLQLNRGKYLTDKHIATTAGHY